MKMEELKCIKCGIGFWVERYLIISLARFDCIFGDCNGNAIQTDRSIDIPDVAKGVEK